MSPQIISTPQTISLRKPRTLRVAGPSGGAFGNDSSTRLLLHCNGANASTVFADSSSVPKAVTAVGNAQVSTAQSKFGGASALFDGTGDYLSIPDDPDFEFGSGDFTIDFWIRFNSVVGGHYPLTKNDGTGFGPLALYQQDTVIYLLATTASGSQNIFNTVQLYSGLATGVWYHMAVLRSSGTWYAFLNGTQTFTSAGAGVLYDNTFPLLIGAYGGGAASLDGWIDEFRISKGVARWTANFTPPTGPYF